MKKDKTLTPDRLRGLLEDRGASPQDLERFDEVTSRRKFFGQLGKGGAALAVLGGFGAGTEAAMQGLFGRGMLPAAMASEVTDEQARKAIEEAGKQGMTVHNARPLNGEWPAHELGDATTPIAKHFVRNNGAIPERAFTKNAQGWTLTIDGEVNKPLKLTLDQLKGMKTVTVRAPIECGGNGRANFDPPVRGNQWDKGAIGSSEWTGVPLRDLLREAGVKDSAVYTGHEGEDPPLSGSGFPISRGIPIDKAMEQHTLVAFQMNGEDLPAAHGWPVRLVVPGWYGSCSHKWLTRVWVRDQVHDGAKMTGYSYRMPAYPVKPGEMPPKEDMVIGTSWPIKSMITGPAPDSQVKAGQAVKVRGHAWAGEDRVAKVMISTDFGNTWRQAKLSKPKNKYDWVQFEGDVKLGNRGYYEIWAQAFDHRGNSQPIIQPWNPRGYEGNVVHRVPVMVG